ncbi:hypothetical protein HFP72_02035 [Nocardiopsis sp. ARC36]
MSYPLATVAPCRSSRTSTSNCSSSRSSCTTTGRSPPVHPLRAPPGARDHPEPHDYAYAVGKEFQVLDEARAYFEALEIGAEQLATVDSVLFDGGLRVFMECAPVWDGEDDLFDVRSLEDLDLVPNLRRFQGAEDHFYERPEMLAALTARGIEVD